MIGISLKIIVISCPLYIITSIHDLIKICDLQMKDKPGKKEFLVLAYFPCNLLFDILKQNGSPNNVLYFGDSES